MDFLQAKNYFIEYDKLNSRENTIKAYELVLSKFCTEFGEKMLSEISSDQV